MPIENESFTLYAKARPRRLVFLIDPQNAPPEQLDAIISANYRLWGGRYNPIIPVSEAVIPAGYWELLKFADPDVVYSYVDLPSDLLKEIDRAISPLLIARHRDDRLPNNTPWFDPSIVTEQTSAFLTVREILDQIQFSIQPPTALLSAVGYTWPHRRFLLRNFGMIEENLWPQPFPEETRKLVVTDDWTDVSLLRQLAATRRILYPFLLSAYGSNFFESQNDHQHAGYCILVGDDVWTWLYFWNRVFLLSDYFRRQFTTICLPPDRLADVDFVNATREFLQRSISRYDSYPARVQVLTLNVGEDETRQLADRLLRGLDAHHQIGRIRSEAFSTLVHSKDIYQSFERGNFLRPIQDLIEQRATGRRVLVRNPFTAPQQFQGRRLMLDLKLEYLPRTKYSSKEYWWQLPKRLGLSHHFLPTRPGRVSVGGIISAEIGDEANIEVVIPDDRDIIWQLLIGDRTPPYTTDIRTRRAPLYGHMENSDKGKYARGVIGLFGGLFHAANFFCNHYWRSIVESFTKGEIERQERLIQELGNWLRRRRNEIVLWHGDDSLTRVLARQLIHISRQQQFNEAEITFADLLNVLVEERQRFEAKHPSRGFDASEDVAREDLLEALAYLTSANVFFQGVKPRCQNCGSAFWYSLAELDGEIHCKGCSMNLQLPPETKWVYRLNSLVLSAAGYYGSPPVLTILNQMENWARTSFIHDTGLEFYNSFHDPRPEVELDIFCVRDGAMVVGEVKGTVEEFGRRELADLAEFAKRVEADVAVIGAFYGEHAQLARHERTLRELLNGTGIQIEAHLAGERCLEPEYHPHV